MVDEKHQQHLEAAKGTSNQVDALQNQLGTMLSGVEKSLAVTCESIMGKMKQLEDKIEIMEQRYSELAKDAEKAIQEAERGQSDTGDETAGVQ